MNAHEEGILNILLHHIGDAPLVHLSLWGIDLTITRHLVAMWVVCVLLIVILSIAARQFSTRNLDRPTRLMMLVEFFVNFIRDDIVKPFVGNNYRPFLPFFCTQFLFILFCNLLGLFPFGKTATANLAVTMALAVVTFIFTQIYGMARQGVIRYWKHLLPEGVPMILSPIIVLNEFVGLFSKPFALMIRLFANMLGGHIILIVLLYLIIMFQQAAIGLGSVPMAVAVGLLEVLECLLQAYIFTFLSAIYIGMAGNEGH
ncbi:MAG: F0F1 ATP synthase subunit A [bacterium]